MKPLSPVAALLWENWRLSRSELVQRVVVGVVGAALALTFTGNKGPYIAFVILLTLFALIWFSISKLNGGQFLDGYKPGFPLYLLYTRPVSTLKFVSVAVLYDAFSCLVLYLVCTAALGLIFGVSLPLFSVTVWLVSFHLLYAAAQWASRNRVIQWVGAIAFSWLYFFLIKDAFQASPMQIHFTFADNALMLVLGIAAFVVTVVGVSRQRSGNAVSTVPGGARVHGYPDWMASPIRIPCPTSSATKAQIWFELKSSGLQIMIVGVFNAIAIALLFVLGIFFPRAREFAIGIPIMFGVPLLLFLGSNAFGIRRKQGIAYMSPFEATQPYRIAQMTWLKILVRSCSVLVAMLTVAASVWLSSSLIRTWGQWIVNGNEVLPKLLQKRDEILNWFVGWTGVAYLQLAVITAISVVAIIALFATYSSLRARYGNRPIYVIAAFPVWFVSVIVLGTFQRAGAISKDVLVGYLTASGVTFLVVVALTTIYLVWSGFKDRSLTIGFACGAALVSAAFVVACLPSDSIPTLLLPALIPLIPLMAAPWSLGRIRHT